jgi:hypothetical protein
MAIKEFITLEGVEEIETKLKRLNALGEDSLANFRNLGSAAGGTADPFGKLVDGAKNAGLELQTSSRHANTLREALHVLHPILQIAGARAGELGSFARLAGAGLSALAIAAGGVVVVGLANLEEQAKKTKAALNGLFGSKEAGTQAFNALEKQAEGLNTSVEGLAPAFESATTALNRFKQTGQGFKFVALRPEDLPTGNIKDTITAVGNLFKILRAGGQDEADAQKSAKAFFDTMKEGGKLTADALKQMDPGAVRLIAAAMGTGAVDAEKFIAQVGLAPIPINKLIERLAKFSEGAQQAFDANAVKSFKDEFAALLRDLQKDFKQLLGVEFSDFLLGELKKFRDDVKQFIADITAIRDAIKAASSPAGGAPVREAAVAEADKLKGVQPFKLTDLFGDAREAEKTVTELGDKTKQAADTGKIAWDDVAKSIKNSSDTAVQAGEEMLQRFKQVESASKSTVKFVQAPLPGVSGLGPTPATTPEQQASQLTNLVKPFQDADDQIRLIWIALVDYITTAFNDIDLSSIVAKLVQPFQDATPQIQSAAQSWWDSIQSIFNNPIKVNFDTSGSSGGPFGGGRASGGLVRGPGSTTSDSIFAWLSDMEYVISARSVKHYGADLFGALNAMALPKDFMNRFAMGGLARSAGNRFASGGQVSSGNSVTLKIDRHTFNMTAGDDTVAAIKRFAVAAQISSTGRKPRFVR